jgi:molybdate-binding protein
VHLADSHSTSGNRGVIEQTGLALDMQLLAVARWEEGVAYAPGLKLRSARQAASSKLRWIGRKTGAGARRCQDEVLRSRPAPRHVAGDHADVVASIRTGFADAGVCVRLVAEEAQTGFLPVSEEDYDLCFPSESADDPRIAALVDVVRSPSYREALAELPGYRLRRAEQTTVKSNR